jgi:dihydroorotate dehydrogenase
MILVDAKGIAVEYGNVFNTSGARNIDGSGWPHHKFIPGLSWEGSTFVARTVTANENLGNMPMKKDGRTPHELLPKCIKVYFGIPATLNAVGLSNPGLEAVLDMGCWQSRTEPFGISLMAINQDLERRYDELKLCRDLLGPLLGEFKAPFFIQLNMSCKNSKVGQRDHFVEETVRSCEILVPLGRPVMPKINALTDPHHLAHIDQHPACAGFVDSNSIHWNDLAKIGIDVNKVFGTSVSPLKEFGGGSLSGPLLHKPVCEHIQRSREAGVTKPFLKEGGNMTGRHTDESMFAGGDAVGVGCLAILRPWTVGSFNQESNLIVVRHRAHRLAGNDSYRYFSEEAA